MDLENALISMFYKWINDYQLPVGAVEKYAIMA